MPRGSQRLRARRAGTGFGSAGELIFRIIGRDGNTLRIIREARNAQEALALYWRGAGANLAGAMMSKDLERRISRVKGAAAGVTDSSTQAPELPFEGMPSDQAATRKPGRPARTREATPQDDLFTSADAPETVRAAEPTAANSEPEPAEDLSDAPPAALHSEETRSDGTTDDLQEADRSQENPILDPQTIMLTRVNPNTLRPSDRPDSYLYHVTSGVDAASALHHGLTVSPLDPIILTERQGVAYWLSALAEDYDFILDGPADFVVLRMRRHAVEDLLERDPVASRNAGCPCFLLTGGNGGVRISG